MLNRAIASLLMVTLVAANFSRLFIFAGFELNKNYIASTLCENKDKPWLHCNGKCYFIKKIKQAEEKERSDERQSQKSLFQEAFFTVASKTKFHSILLQVIPIPNNRIILPETTSTIFRPPQLG